MANVLIAGIEHPDQSAVERRLFVRAVADLDLPHVDLLQRMSERIGFDPDTDHDLALLGELVHRGLVRRMEKVTGGTRDFLVRPARFSVEHNVSPLGRRFLEYLQTSDNS